MHPGQQLADRPIPSRVGKPMKGPHGENVSRPAAVRRISAVGIDLRPQVRKFVALEPPRKRAAGIDLLGREPRPGHTAEECVEALPVRKGQDRLVLGVDANEINVGIPVLPQGEPEPLLELQAQGAVQKIALILVVKDEIQGLMIGKQRSSPPFSSCLQPAIRAGIPWSGRRCAAAPGRAAYRRTGGCPPAAAGAGSDWERRPPGPSCVRPSPRPGAR